MQCMTINEKLKLRKSLLTTQRLSLIRRNLVPDFITFVGMTGGMAKEFVYSSLKDFLLEDNDRLSELYDLFDTNKQRRLYALYETMTGHANGCLRLGGKLE